MTPEEERAWWGDSTAGDSTVVDLEQWLLERGRWMENFRQHGELPEDGPRSEAGHGAPTLVLPDGVHRDRRRERVARLALLLRGRPGHRAARQADHHRPPDHPCRGVGGRRAAGVRRRAHRGHHVLDGAGRLAGQHRRRPHRAREGES
ncbi:hypothetical protein NKG94_23750 [Micromonospora sp. M12]